MSTTAIDVNDTRGLHVATLTRDALRNMGRYIAGADVLIRGASYRQDVGDTRYSGSEIVVRKLTEMGAEMRVHDPYVDCFGILSDDKIRRYFELGCEVKGLGRGHIQRIKEDVRSRRR